MRRRDEWIDWVRAAERECDVVAYGLELLSQTLQRDPSSLAYRRLGREDYLGASRNREATYLVRLFALFENGLREAWAGAFGETTHPGAADLITAFAARCRVPFDRVDDAHLVRVFRNRIVHDDAEPTDPVSLAQARRFLCRFFSHLPENW